MSYRNHLPQLEGDLFLTDGGLETVLIFDRGLELPAFAAFDLLKDEAGIEALRGYYAPFADLAHERGVGFVLESPTWRASPGWAEQTGYGGEELTAMNCKAIALMAELRALYEDGPPIVISGCVGPQGDGYNPAAPLTADTAQEYHATQIETLRDTEADMVTALTMTYADEAIGIARAAAEAGLPAAISFTLETDGRLPSGLTLGEAIEKVDVETGAAPAYYMINCAHPTHFESVLDPDEPWISRLRGLRANASMLSHAELDEAAELDAGDPVDLGARYAALRAQFPQLNVLGGCCGTDLRHVTEICNACS